MFEKTHHNVNMSMVKSCFWFLQRLFEKNNSQGLRCGSYSSGVLFFCHFQIHTCLGDISYSKTSEMKIESNNVDQQRTIKYLIVQKRHFSKQLPFQGKCTQFFRKYIN